MLTRIEIDGFKTFRDFTLDVPPFLVVLGQNGVVRYELDLAVMTTDAADPEGTHPQELRRDDGYDDPDRMTPEGRHIPNALARIVRRTREADRRLGALNDVVADLATVIPEVLDVRLDDFKERRTRGIAITTMDDGEFVAESVSDGTSHSPDVLLALPEAPPTQLVRDDAVFLELVSRVTPGAVDRVSRARAIRAGVEAPLPVDLPAPLFSFGEIDAFLGRGQ